MDHITFKWTEFVVGVVILSIFILHCRSENEFANLLIVLSIPFHPPG